MICLSPSGRGWNAPCSPNRSAKGCPAAEPLPPSDRGTRCVEPEPRPNPEDLTAPILSDQPAPLLAGVKAKPLPGWPSASLDPGSGHGARPHTGTRPQPKSQPTPTNPEQPLDTPPLLQGCRSVLAALTAGAAPCGRGGGQPGRGPASFRHRRAVRHQPSPSGTRSRTTGYRDRTRRPPRDGKPRAPLSRPLLPHRSQG